MRDIKFRGKLCHSNEWVVGCLIVASNGCHYIYPSDVIKPDGHRVRFDTDDAFWVEPETVGQFTGCLDKNGTEIYEGDMVERDYGDDGLRDPRKDTVKWVSGGLCLWNSSYTVGHYSNLKVTGNIHSGFCLH